jgi:transposase
VTCSASRAGAGSGLQLASEERETVDGCMRQIEFLDSEIAAVERLIAQALDCEQIRRLMSVPGVNVIVAASFLAAIGEIGRFQSPRKLVGYLGLDPRVRPVRARPRDPRAHLKAGLGARTPRAPSSVASV